MKILLLAPHAFLIDRGSPMDVDILLRALSERGEQVDAVVYPEGEERRYKGVRIFRPPSSRWTADVGPSFSFKKLVCDAKMFAVAWRLVRENEYDVVHAGEESVFMAMFFKIVHGIPYVYDLDSSIAQQMVERFVFLSPLAWLFNYFEKLAIRNCAAAAPVCNALAKLARQRGAPHVITLHDISQLDFSVETKGRRIRDELGLNGTVLMYIGNLEPYQGVDLLLSSFEIALAKGVDADLIVAGGTDAHVAQYKAKARRRGIHTRTHFIGPWAVDRLTDLISEADILTAPRITGINTPMKVFPYLHSGKPVLVTDLPTHSQILTKQVAFLAPASPELFAEGIERLVNDLELRAELGAAGRAFVEENHTFQAHQRRVDELYDYVTGVVKNRVEE